MLKNKTPNSRLLTQNYNLRLLTFTLNFCLFTFYFLLFGYAQEQFVYDARGKRNPFIPIVTPDGRLLKLDKEETHSDLLVEGIIYDKHGRSYAIVNGIIVGIGDVVGDYQVLKIEESKVTFIKEGQVREVGIKKEDAE